MKKRPKPLLLILLLIAITTFFFNSASAQEHKNTVTGFVTDSLGGPLAGVSIELKGKVKIGTTTDVNGGFVLVVPDSAVLVISMTGYETREISAWLQKEINVVLYPSQSTLGAVVITAFGRKERKEAVVGSVTSIEPGTLKTPSSNLTTALAGKLAGMVAFQRSGQPGQDNASFFIRGVTTLGYSAQPLILVDNIELSPSDLSRLQVDDIASFSILKDASASALYGARGANGVILITTKEGKDGKATVNVRGETSISMPTKNLQLADPITYMKNYNEAITTRNPLQTPYFTPNQILATQATINHTAGSNPYVYPAVDWMSTLFKKQAITKRVDLNVSGGNLFAKYYISGSYSRDNGILQRNPGNNFNSGMKFENYQLRANTNVKITKTTEAVVRVWGNFNDYVGPITSNPDGLATDLYSKALHTSPVAFTPFFPPDRANQLTQHILFGNAITLNGGLQDNPYADLMYGYKNFSESRMSAQFELNQNFDFITKGLSFHGIFSTNRYSYFDLSRSYKPFYYGVKNYDKGTGAYTLTWLNDQPGQAQEFLSYNEGPKTLYTYVYLQGNLSYNRNFGKNGVGATLIGTRQQTQYGNAGSLLTSLPYRNLGISGRLSYSYDNKYFVEFNFGYNGSERFAPEHRFGLFPTIGGGWIVSKEKFWNDGLANIITHLKVRGSYGLVGNDNIGNQRFFYLSSVVPDGGPAATFGSTNAVTLNGTDILAYPNLDVTWEKAKKANLAIEMTLFKDLDITAEIYHEFRHDILIPRSYIPVTAGISNSALSNLQSNEGTAYSKGVDININYKHSFSNNLWVSVLGNLTLTSSKVGHLDEPAYKEKYRLRSGQPINQPFGYIAERLFVDDKEAANSPTQLFGGNEAMGGDIKYRDVNGDGAITEADMVPIGLPTTPQIIYGFGFSLGYKNFDLSAFFQGLARESFFIDPAATAPFVNSAQLLQAYADNHWSEENQNLYALWPRFSATNASNINNEQLSTWWMRDGSFMRLKSLEVGYTIPARWAKYIKTARIYFNGLNLVTFSHFRIWDPEQAANGFAYPVQKVFNLGLNLNF
jgi:TonB-linked SusC/RagA family outer membrane protein